MRSRTIIPALALFPTILATAMAAEKPADKTDTVYSLADAGELHVVLPPGWTGESDNGTPATIALKAAAGKHVSVQITSVPGKSADSDLKRAAEQVGAGYAAGSKEKKTVLEEIKGPAVHGYASSYTDASDNPGEFRCVTAGVVASNGQVLAVTLLYNDKTSADRVAAAETLKTLSVSVPPGGAAAAATIASPDGKWTLSIAGKWKVLDNSKSPDGRSREVTATSADGSLMLSIFLEPAAKGGGDAKAAREFYLSRMKQNPLPMNHLKTDVVGDVATLDYDQGPEQLKQHNLNAYLSHDGVWVDVHGILQFPCSEAVNQHAVLRVKTVVSAEVIHLHCDPLIPFIAADGVGIKFNPYTGPGTA
jgi:hypothetical protein